MPRGKSLPNSGSLNFGNRGIFLVASSPTETIGLAALCQIFGVAPAAAAFENQLIPATLGLVAAERSAAFVVRQHWQQTSLEALNYPVSPAISFVSGSPAAVPIQP
jgi:hypothetical protein